MGHGTICSSAQVNISHIRSNYSIRGVSRGSDGSGDDDKQGMVGSRLSLWLGVIGNDDLTEKFRFKWRCQGAVDPRNGPETTVEHVTPSGVHEKCHPPRRAKIKFDRTETRDCTLVPNTRKCHNRFIARALVAQCHIRGMTISDVPTHTCLGI